MLRDKEMFNGMRLIKAVGLDKLNVMQMEIRTITTNEELDDAEKKAKVGSIILNFYLGAFIDAEVELKKLLTDWKGIDKKDFTADELLTLTEEFMTENTPEEIGSFFKRVLGLMSKMR